MTEGILAPATHARATSAWLLVAGIILASLTEALASTVLSLGRADIIGDIHATPDEFAWLEVSYTALKLIGFAVAPWLLTRLAPRSVLLAATLVMGTSCAAAAITPPLGPFIVLRGLQGFAGAVLLVTGQAMLFWNYRRSLQPILQAGFAVGSVVAPATIAPALQGWLLDSHSWTWIFFAVLPLSLLASGVLLMAHHPQMRAPAPRALDWLGLALLGPVLLGITYVLSQGSRWDWFEEKRITLSALAVLAASLLFILRQRFASSPLVDLKAFRTPDFTFAFIVSFVAGAALFGSAFLIPGFAVAVLGFTPTEAGMLLLPSSALFAGSLLLAAFLFQRRGVPPVATVPLGILLIMLAMWLLSLSSGESGAEEMMPAILLRGFGLGFLFLSITLIAFNQLDDADIPSGIGIFNIGRQLGGLIGVAGLQTLIDHHSVTNRVVLGAWLNSGSVAAGERLATLSSLLVERGLDARVAGAAAQSMIARTLGREGVVIAFDTAFVTLTLLFVVAAPILVGIKILLSRRARLAGDRARAHLSQGAGLPAA